MAKLKAGAQTARLITVNHEGESYEIVPGGAGSVAVDVPNSIAKSPFVKALVEDGSLILSDVTEDEPEDDLDALREEAEKLGIKVDKRWKAERIQQEIDSKE